MEDQLDHPTNMNLQDIATPINVHKLQELLRLTKYDPHEIDYLVEGFSSGFDIGYRGPTNRKNLAKNIPFTIGDERDMWTKLLKEIKLGRVASPFDQPLLSFLCNPP